MRSAAAEARAARSPGGAGRPDPAGSRPDGQVAGSAGPQPGLRSRGQSRGAGPQAVHLAPSLASDVFVLRVLLEDSGEMFRVTNCRSDMTVRELKEELDLMLGVPFNLQRLQYLDQVALLTVDGKRREAEQWIKETGASAGILMDEATLKFYDVVPGGIISLCIWHYDGWTELVLAAVEGDCSKLSFLGVTEDSFYRTANSQHFEDAQRRKWVAQRAFVALYIASHRGHREAVQYLLEHGANCLGRSPVGRTPLHVAAAMGQLDCISLLLNYGASVNDKDAKGETPMTLARRLNRSQSERRMFLFHWVVKLGLKGTADPAVNKAFQRVKSRFDSKKNKA